MILAQPHVGAVLKVAIDEDGKQTHAGKDGVAKPGAKEDEAEAERLGKESTRLSQMRGQHKKRIRELEALQETTVQVEVETKCMRLALAQEEAQSVRTETRTVPAKKPQQPRETYLYVMGGMDAQHNRLSSVERLNVESKRWEVVEGASMNSRRGGCAAAVLDGQVYVAGGHDGKAPLSTVERLVAEEERWEVLPARLQTARTVCAGAVLGGALHVLGGVDNALLNLLVNLVNRS